MKEKRVTLQDIANALHITSITVSRALNNKPGVSEDLAKHIKQYALQAGYTRRGKDSSESAQKQKTVMLLVADVFLKTQNTMYIDFYKKILDSLQKKNIIGILNIVNEQETASCSVPEILYKPGVDMLLLLGELPADYLSIICTLDIPVLLIDFYDDRLALDAVTNNNFFDSFLLTRYLIQNGHRRIAFIGNINSTHSIQDRFLGYSKALIRSDIDISAEYIISDRNHNGEFTELKLPSPLPTAFVCNCDEIAHKLIRQLEDLHIRVPDDCSVVAFNDTHFSTDSEPKITTIASDSDTMALKSVEIIVRKMKSPEYRAGLVPIRGVFIKRNSVKNILAKENGKPRKSRPD